MPPLDPARFTGRFDWLDEPRHPDPDGRASVATLDRELRTVGLAIPQDVATFFAHQPLGHLLTELSSGWYDLSMASEPLLPSPVERDARLVRILTDQQDCVAWYLYLRPGQTFVVHAYGLEFEDDHPDAGTRLFGKIFWCAPSLEEFAYRCWVEARIADYLLEGREHLLAGELRDYLDFYRERPAQEWPREWTRATAGRAC